MWGGELVYLPSAHILIKPISQLYTVLFLSDQINPTALNRSCTR